MTMRSVLSFALCAAVVLPAAAAGTDDERLRNAEAVLKEMAETFDTGIPQSLLAKARCIVIIPGVKRAAFGIGGQYGRGYLACRRTEEHGSSWSAPGGIRIEGGSIGFQIGGSSTDVVLLVMNDRGVDRLLSNRFTVGADASVAAGPVGRQATAQTDATMMAEMLSWSRSRGVFAGISLQGSTLREDSGENRDLYGKELSNREIVKGNVAVPKAAESLIRALGKY